MSLCVCACTSMWFVRLCKDKLLQSLSPSKTKLELHKVINVAKFFLSMRTS